MILVRENWHIHTVWGPIMGRVQLMGMFHSFALIVNSLIN